MSNLCDKKERIHGQLAGDTEIEWELRYSYIKDSVPRKPEKLKNWANKPDVV